MRREDIKDVTWRQHDHQDVGYEGTARMVTTSGAPPDAYPDIDSCYIVRWEMSANHVKESCPVGIGAIRPSRILEFLV